MSLPPKVDEQIRRRFEGMISQSNNIHAKIQSATQEAERRAIFSAGHQIVHVGQHIVCEEEFTVIKNLLLSLIQLFSTPNNKYMNQTFEQVTNLESTLSGIAVLKGHIQALSQSYNDGMLTSLSKIIEANVVADYMGQAERLLTEGQPGKYDHVPAAVLTGAILEDGLRRLCDRNSIPLFTVKRDGSHKAKTLGTLIDDLKKADIFNELKAKQLRAWADIRNAAAHGRFEDFTKEDVEQMLMSVQNFLADYM